MSDEIRAKRLAKLAGSQPSPSSSPALPSDPSKSDLQNVSPSSSPSVVSTPIPITPSSPSLALAPAPAPVSAPQTSTPVYSSPIQPTPMDLDVEKKKKPQIPDTWENDTLQRVLRASLNPVSNSNLLYLEDLSLELKSENIPLSFTKDLIDRVIVARLSISDIRKKDPQEPTHFEYLYATYERAYQEERRVSTFKDSAEKVSTLQVARQFATSYAGLVIQMPEMFSAESNVSAINIFADKLLNRSVLPEFIGDLVERFKDDGLDTIFNRLLVIISNNMRQQSFTKNYSPPIEALAQLLSYKPIASLATNLQSWCPKNCTAREFEMISFLGPFLRPSTSYEDEPTLADQHFPNTSRITLQEVNASLHSLRMTVHGYQNHLHAAVKSLLTTGSDVREKVLQYIAESIGKNEKRAQMQVDRNQVSSDGFMMNLVAVALKLCEPFVLPEAKKLKLVDPEYPLRSSRFNISKESRLKATSDEVETWQKANISEESKKAYAPNFITECFFLSSQILHFGLIPNFTQYGNILKKIRDVQKAQKRLQEGPPNPQVQTFLQQQLDILVKAKFAYDVQLNDPELLSAIFRYYNFFFEYMIYLADPNQKGLPLSKDSPITLKSLPEFFVEDATEFFLFLARFVPQNLLSCPLHSLVNFIVMFLAQPEYIKSPHLRSKFAEILFTFTPEFLSHAGVSSMEYLFSCNEFVLQNLSKSLMDFYQEVENTGSSHQFYEKFNVRYHISIVMKIIWNNDFHKERIRIESSSDDFVRFVNLLLNDTTYLLDESLTKLAEIHTVQEKMKDIASWNRLPENERKEIEESHRMNERRCQSLLFLAKETLFMLGYLTNEIHQPFLKPQIITRLVAMLNYNVAQLVGPKCQELKVQNQEKYGFNPKELLSLILEIYVSLYKPTFVEAMVQEGRSYNKVHFDKACNILRRFMLKPEEKITLIEQLIAEVQSRKERETQEIEELGEVPDEFLDPITYVTMADPVQLPSSKQIVDRSTIETHLLSDPTDPFNRSPLTIDQVIPVTDLKDKIQAFLSKRRAP